MTLPQDSAYAAIPLTQGQVALVDTTDYEWLMQWKWYAWWNKTTQSFYAMRDLPTVNKKRFGVMRMHRQILCLENGDKRVGDHIRSGNTLDNRRSNLRIANQLENSRNSRINRNNKTGFKGVSLFRPGQWRADIRAGGKTIFLGLHSTPESAHAAYCSAAERYHGEFACTG